MALSNVDLLCYTSGGQEFEIGLVKQGCVSSEDSSGEYLSLPYPDSRSWHILWIIVLFQRHYAMAGHGFLILHQSDTPTLLSLSFTYKDSCDHIVPSHR